MSQNKETAQEEEALQSALAPIVNKLIDENFENSGDKIASQMAPLIGGAIREQIKSQKDDVVDALYPVMGNMISKFVTKSLEELLNKINEQIQNGLSIQAVKRKIKAKIKGVSETELLLQESSEAYIKAVLLIHKESGMLLAKVEDESQKLSDADMLASMMTAIRSFVNEWISTNEQNQELGEIEYGGNKIIIEASGSSYLAVIVEGAAYTKTYNKIRHALEKIIVEFGESIQSFEGSYETLEQQKIQKRLEELLLTKNNEEITPQEKKTHPLLYILPLLLVAFLAYRGYKDYIDEELQNKISKAIIETPVLSPFAITVDVEDKNVTLKGRVPFAYHKELAEKEAKKSVGITTITNKIEVIPTLTDPMQLSAQIAYLIKGINFSSKSNISYTFDYKNLHLFGTTDSKAKKEYLLHELKAMQGIENIQDDIIILYPKIDTNIYFGRASEKLSQSAKEKLLTIVSKVKDKDQEPKFVVDAYSDMVGSKEKNAQLAQRRINSIIEFLEKNMGHKVLIESHIHHKAPEGVDPQKDPDMARCVTLKAKWEQE